MSNTYGRSNIILGILLRFGTAIDFIINVAWGAHFHGPVILSYILVYLRLVDEEMSFLLYWSGSVRSKLYSLKVKVGEVDKLFGGFIWILQGYSFV